MFSIFKVYLLFILLFVINAFCSIDYSGFVINTTNEVFADIIYLYSRRIVELTKENTVTHQVKTTNTKQK